MTTVSSPLARTVADRRWWLMQLASPKIAPATMLAIGLARSRSMGASIGMKSRSAAAAGVFAVAFSA